MSVAAEGDAHCGHSMPTGTPAKLAPVTTTTPALSAAPVSPGPDAPVLPRTPPRVFAALAALLLVAGVVYAAGIPLGLVHNYYGPAVYSMSQNWTAWFWGAQDPAAMLTLDKLPGAFQLQALSARIFGYSTWSVLLPQVVAAVAAIGVLFATVRRWLGPYAALAASVALATTPIVAALAHSQIVDTWLMLLLVCAAWAWTRAVQSGRLGWLLLAGFFVGCAFNVKMVQAWGVLPALALGYWLFAPGTRGRRTVQVLAAGAVTAVVSLWWLVVATIVPAGQRPWIDGSAANSAWEMVFGYNLFTRYTDTAGTPGGTTGWDYLITGDVATQAGWLYPLALLGLVGGLWWTRRSPRTDPVRAGLVMWGLWLAAHTVAFSLGRVAHSFYVEAIAPSIAALATAGVVLGWRAWRDGRRSGWLLPTALVATLAWTVWLQSRYPTFLPWLTPIVLALGAVGLFALSFTRSGRTPHRAAAPVAAGVLAASVLLAPGAWAASTMVAGYSGSNIGPAAGPVQSMGGPPMAGDTPTDRGLGQPQPGWAPGPVQSMGGSPMAGGTPRDRGMGQPQPGSAAGPGGMPGGGGGNAQASTTLGWIRANDPGSRFELAVIGSQGGGDYILAGGKVLPIGGFTGSMPNVTAEQLATMVANGDLHYVLLGRGGGGGGAANSALTSWVTTRCSTVTDAAASGLYRCG